MCRAKNSLRHFAKWRSQKFTTGGARQSVAFLPVYPCLAALPNRQNAMIWTACMTMNSCTSLGTGLS